MKQLYLYSYHSAPDYHFSSTLHTCFKALPREENRKAKIDVRKYSFTACMYLGVAMILHLPLSSKVLISKDVCAYGRPFLSRITHFLFQKIIF